jgi:hypothetical protein
MGPVVGELWFREGQAGAEGGSSANLDQAELNTVGYVVSRYGRLTASDLVNLTHAERPWQIANARRRPGESVRIERSWLLEFFQESSVDDDDEVLDSDTVSSWLAGVVAARDGRGAGRPDSREELLARLTRG